MLNGNLQLKPTGMTGNGIMNFAASELEAKLFNYKLNMFGADTSDFRLTSDRNWTRHGATSTRRSVLTQIGEWSSKNVEETVAVVGKIWRPAT